MSTDSFLIYCFFISGMGLMGKEAYIAMMGKEAYKRLRQCRFCGQNFSRPSHVLRHEQRHTGEKPFPCHICQRSFSRNYMLSKHILLCHMN